MSQGAVIVRINGALAEVRPLPEASLYELVRVGERRLLAEVVRIEGDTASVQVFEETFGLAVGEPVESTGGSLRAWLGPGLLGSTLDGVGRPLLGLAERFGDFLVPGADAPSLDAARRWSFDPRRESGLRVVGGDLLGVVEERPGLEHRILVPPNLEGRLVELRGGEVTLDDVVGRLDDGTELRLMQRWPVRIPRPFAERHPGRSPLVTGQRVFDFLFPVAEGGSVALPGGFGTGKTVIEQALAKYCEADVIVYIGCGERGNEMAEVLSEFPELTDPRTDRPLLDRTVLVVNTSNMPVAARDASVYLGMTIGEYYRDMGYRVAVLADSISRWAEAHREIGARLGEMPGEEGYPPYLANRLAQLYERAGRVRCLGEPERTGSVTFISAVSPPGGDLSEPVTQASLRVSGGLWALSSELAHARQYPALDWETSYSLYCDATAEWFEERGGEGWSELRRDILDLLDRDRELREIAGLVGADALEDRDRLELEVARLARETLLAQSALDPADAFSPPVKTHRLASVLIELWRRGAKAIEEGVPYQRLDLGPVRRAVIALRSAPAESFAEVAEAADRAIAALLPDAREHMARETRA